MGLVPPVTVSVIEPLLPLLHNKFTDATFVNTGLDVVEIVDTEVNVHPEASFATTVYVFEHKLLNALDAWNGETLIE
jgi:hypothetical protein